MINWPAPGKVRGVADELIAQVNSRLPVINRLLNRSPGENLKLKDYLAELTFSKSQPLQAFGDLGEALKDYITPVLGEQIAAELTQELENYPVILTANHHGVDYFAQSFQGNLLFLLYRRMFGGSSTITPIFSCGGVPLSNSSYPKGILVYDSLQPDSGELPFKLPVFPNNLNQTVVHAAPRFHEELIRSVLKRLEKEYTRQLISRRAFETINELFYEEYLDPVVLNQPHYPAQATLLNNRLGKRIFAAPSDLPELVYIEFEAITSLILKKDLNNPESLIFRIFFDADLRSEIIKNLNGKKGCWNLEKLTDLTTGALTIDTGRHSPAGFGSIFFWGADIMGRRYPLTIMPSGTGEPYLVGIDGLKVERRIPFNPSAILLALESKLIFPNLFTMFTVISLARGMVCVGGYFQSGYLPVIQQGLAQALNSIPEYRSYAEKIINVATDFYLSGMMFLLAEVGQKFAVPAGPIEIISRGGLRNGFLEDLQSLSLDVAHRIGLFGIYPDIFSRQERMEKWQERLAFELYRENPQWILPAEQ